MPWQHAALFTPPIITGTPLENQKIECVRVHESMPSEENLTQRPCFPTVQRFTEYACIESPYNYIVNADLQRNEMGQKH